MGHERVELGHRGVLLAGGLHELWQARCDLRDNHGVVGIALQVPAIHVDRPGHRHWRDEAYGGPHRAGDREEERGHASRLVDHDRQGASFLEGAEGAPEVSLVLAHLPVHKHLPGLPVQGVEVMRPLADVDAAAHFIVRVHQTPFCCEELARAEAAASGITLRADWPRGRPASTYWLLAGANGFGGMTKRIIFVTSAPDHTEPVGCQRRRLPLSMLAARQADCIGWDGVDSL